MLIYCKFETYEKVLVVCEYCKNQILDRVEKTGEKDDSQMFDIIRFY